MEARLPSIILTSFLVGGIVLTAVFYVAGTEGDAEGFGSALGVSAPLLGGGLLLTLGVGRDHRWLVLTVGIVVTLICIIYYVLIPLALLTIYTVARHGWWPTSLVDAAVGVGAAAGIGVAQAVLLFRQTPDGWQTETSSSYSSDIVTSGEAAFAVVLVVVVVVTTSAWSRARV